MLYKGEVYYVKFSLLLIKVIVCIPQYHCWKCGDIYCSKCIQKHTPLAGHYSQKPVPVCKQCYKVIKSSRSSVSLQQYSEEHTLSEDLVISSPDGEWSSSLDNSYYITWKHFCCIIKAQNIRSKHFHAIFCRMYSLEISSVSSNCVPLDGVSMLENVTTFCLSYFVMRCPYALFCIPWCNIVVLLFLEM